MRVEAVRIKNFRSVSSGELEACGGFNVLIGKNNSGKSNILSAIDAFFLALGDGDIICLNPIVENELAFYNRDSTVPAEITMTLSLDNDERSRPLGRHCPGFSSND